ncbi:hypothetical protein [Hymenobacter aerophilus]|uniref:hypothetical protein n=1 Tax=Hymenobacter aerophilus TaxID=119644 RepID=UPI00037B7D83|nr:hypothetical protein [Hymenobacter aerophilus]
MNDPTKSSARTQDAIDGGILAIYASPATWLKVVAFYKHLLAPSPKQAGPAVAIFQMEHDSELHIILTDDQATLAKQASQTTWHLPVAEAYQVEKAMQYAQDMGIEIVLGTTAVWAFPIPTEFGSQAVITLGTVRFKTHQQLSSEDTTVGVIHNPNW